MRGLPGRVRLSCDKEASSFTFLEQGHILSGLALWGLIVLNPGRNLKLGIEVQQFPGICDTYVLRKDEGFFRFFFFSTNLYLFEDLLEEGMATHSSILAWRIPMDRQAWQATVHGVTKSWTRLKWLSTHSRVWICRYTESGPSHPWNSDPKTELLWRLEVEYREYLGFPGGSDCKESSWNAEDLGSISGWEGRLEEGMATHSSILAWRIPMDRQAWRAIVHGVAKSRTWLSG